MSNKKIHRIVIKATFDRSVSSADANKLIRGRLQVHDYQNSTIRRIVIDDFDRVTAQLFSETKIERMKARVRKAIEG